MKNPTLFFAPFVFCAVIFAVWGGTRIVMAVQFDRNCGGYMKRAADANTVALASQQLKIAVDYIERTGLTNGFTSILYKTPADDVGFWHSNLRSALDELNSLPEDSQPLERSNMLMKLRETIQDHAGDSGTRLTLPKGISIYPNNVAFAWWAVGSLSVCAVFWFLAVRE